MIRSDVLKLVGRQGVPSSDEKTLDGLYEIMNHAKTIRPCDVLTIACLWSYSFGLIQGVRKERKRRKKA